MARWSKAQKRFLIHRPRKMLMLELLSWVEQRCFLTGGGITPGDTV